MPKKRRQARIPTPAWERPRGTIGSRVLGRSFQFYGAVAVALLLGVGLGVIGYAFWNDYWEEQGRPGSIAVQVDDTRYRLDYFSRRLKMYADQVGGQNPDAAQPISALPAVSDLLIQEEIVRRFAGEMDMAATEQEITDEIATRLGITADDESFEVVYQQELARSELSETDYRQMIEAAVLTDKLKEKFLAEAPQSAESVHYRQILVSTDETAQEIRDKIESGEDFAALAVENSLDVETRENGGDMGWLARRIFDASMEELVFNLEPGDITTIPTQSGVLVIEMLEKDSDHPVEENQKEPLATRALADWVEEKRQSLSIVNNVDVGGGDPDKIQWAIEQAYQS